MKTLEQLISEMKQYGFGMSGSRRMAEKFPEYIKVQDDTDWDFYCSNDDKFHDFLNKNGFMRIECENRNYLDDLLMDIWKHDTYPIEALIRSDIDCYRKTFESITPGDFIDNLWKSAPHRKVNINKAQFRDTVCRRFNQMFQSNDLPF